MILQIISFTTLLLCTVIMIITSILSKKSISDWEKSSPFECEFDSKASARIPFSLQFFLIAAIFLISDEEITLLFPLVPTMKITSMISFFSM